MGIGAVSGLDELCVAVDPIAGVDLTVNQGSNRSRGKTLF